MKKFLLIIMLLTTCMFTMFFISFNNEKIVESDEIQTREVVGEKEDEVFCMMNRVMGGGGYANQNIAEYAGTVAGGGGGVALVGLGYFISNQLNNFIDELLTRNSNNITIESSSLSIDDVLDNPNVKKGMEEYGWSRTEIIKWLEIMLGVSLDRFLNDSNIEVYLGSTHSELKYDKYRDISNHKYTYHIGDDEWDSFVSIVCNNNGGMIWTLNMAFLQMCIMKNAKFVLVTPKKMYYDYNRKKIIRINNKICSYSKELQYINMNGYSWSNFESPLVKTSKSITNYA